MVLRSASARIKHPPKEIMIKDSKKSRRRNIILD
jgi:hypothetical protein